MSVDETFLGNFNMEIVLRGNDVIREIQLRKTSRVF